MNDLDMTLDGIAQLAELRRAWSMVQSVLGTPIETGGEIHLAITVVPQGKPPSVSQECTMATVQLKGEMGERFRVALEAEAESCNADISRELRKLLGKDSQ